MTTMIHVAQGFSLALRRAGLKPCATNARVGALTLIFAVAIASRPGATTFAPTDFAELVNGSAAIVHGRVVATRAEWADRRAHVETLVTIQAEQYFKGDLGALVEVRVPGGELGRYRDVVVGAPKLAVGDDVILCLSTKGGGAPHVFGLMLGVFRVRHDGGQAFVSPAPALATDGAPRRIVRGSRAQAPVAIQTFAAIVDEVAASARARRRP